MIPDRLKKTGLIVAYLWAALEILSRPFSGIPLMIQDWIGISPIFYALYFIVGACAFFYSSHTKKPANVLWYLPFLLGCLAVAERGLNDANTMPGTTSVAFIAFLFVVVDYGMEYVKWRQEPQ